MKKSPAILVFALAALGGCAPDGNGEWVGACDLPDQGLRVWVTVQPEIPAVLRLWMLSHPANELDATCTGHFGGGTLDVAGCGAAAWLYAGMPVDTGDSGTGEPPDTNVPPGPLAFELHGEVAAGETTSTLSGTCSWEGASGTATMMRMASEEPDEESRD